MKILHLNAFDAGTGSATALLRLHISLLDKGVDSIVYVQNKRKNFEKYYTDTGFFVKLRNSLRWRLSSLPKLFYKIKATTPFSTNFLPKSNFNIIIKKYNPDIIHLHWVAGGMLNVKDLNFIDKPIVWTMHDAWAFTGGCHIIGECRKFIDHCSSCPILLSTKENDISFIQYQQKKKTYNTINNLVVVGVSQWITNFSIRSSLLNKFKHLVIPNMINTSIFNILPRNDLYKDLNLNSQKKYIAIGAQSILLDENKGFGKFIEAISKINRNDFEIIVFGTNNLNTPKINNNYIRNFGIINDYNLLIKIYNISDAMIVPSIQESFGQTALESLSCGTPVVCFATSGLNEIIDHKINGYKAKPYDSIDLARGIEWVLDHTYVQNLRNNARLKAVNSYDSSIIVNSYIKIYSSLTNNKSE